jgi:branched-subunit amino acid transport protein
MAENGRSMNEFLMIAGMALVTVAVRYPVMVLVNRIPLPDRVFRALRYVPPAVLAAIIAPSVLMPSGERIDVSLSNSFLVAGLISIVVAWRTKNLLLTIVIGMAALFLYRAFLNGLG